MGKYTIASIAVGTALALMPMRFTLLGIPQPVMSPWEPVVAVAGAIIAIVFTFLTFALPENSEWRGGVKSLLAHDDASLSKGEVDTAMKSYESFHGTDSRESGEQHKKLLEKRKTLYASMVNHFYDLVTDFYEYGWGESFHFAARDIKETFDQSIRRCEYYIALICGIQEGQKVSDLGCGVGGLLSYIVKFTGATVYGVNNNDYQIKLATKHNERDNVQHLIKMMKADFHKIPVQDGFFDHAYAIEATCHATDKLTIYSEAFRIVKPGGKFICIDWLMTHKYDPKNVEHNRIKQGIEVGNGLPNLETIDNAVQAMKKAGFEVLEHFDRGYGKLSYEKNQIPWHQSLKGSWRLSEFRMNSFGRKCTNTFVYALETLRIAPKGSYRVSKLLSDTADDLVKGGDLQIMTPAYFIVARKPLH